MLICMGYSFIFPICYFINLFIRFSYDKRKISFSLHFLVTMLWIMNFLYLFTDNIPYLYNISTYIHELRKLHVTLLVLLLDFTLKLLVSRFLGKNLHHNSLQSQIINKHSSKARDTISLPNIDLLDDHKGMKDPLTKDTYEAENQKRKLTKVLGEYGVQGEVVGYFLGHVVITYEFALLPGTKAEKIFALSDDISRSMCVNKIRITTILGKNTLGIEIPQYNREIIYFRNLLQNSKHQRLQSTLPIILGANTHGRTIVSDLTDMVHVLIAGSTGSGKSISVHSFILSLLYSKNSRECKFLMIDPKMLELSIYQGIPNLILPVANTIQESINILKWLVTEMETRYQLMSSIGVRDIKEYNNLASTNHKIPSDIFQDKKNNQMNSVILCKRLPYIVLVIDEMADLMLLARKEIETYIQRISQMARASGIHLIVSTQRPSVDVITGVIKANFPSRISFRVVSKFDSKTIIETNEATQLLGQGDMLHFTPNSSLQRIHAPFISTIEVKKVVCYLKQCIS